MAYDEGLAERVRDLLALHADVTERKMFGGIAWMVAGNMACGVLGEDLIVRLAPEEAEGALAEAHTRPFDVTGRPLKGFLFISPEATDDEVALAGWVEAALAFAGSLPAKGG
jgi:TfoX/Sxy family transcriptional regulator of competence genes